MKICSVCLKSDILCSGCTKRLETKQITNTDIELSRALFKLGFDVDFVKSFEEGNVYVLANKKHAGLLIGREGRNAKRIGIMLGKDLRVIENTDDEKKLIERILGTQVIGINKIYGKEESYKIRIEKRMKRRLVDPKVVSRFINKPVQFHFE